MTYRARASGSLLALGWALCLLLACAPSAPPRPAPLPAAQGPESSQAAPAQRRTLLDEHFQRTWPNDPHGSAWFGDGAYTLFARQPGQFVAIRAPLAEVPGDVTVSGTFHKVGGPVGGGYGLIVRDQSVGAGDGVDQEGQFLVAEVGDRGEVGIWQRADTRWVDLLPWTPSALVHPGEAPNELKVEVVGNRLHFDVNGSLAGDVQVGFPAGAVGLFVGGDMNQVQLDRLVVEAAAAVAAPPTTASRSTTSTHTGAAVASAGQTPAAAPEPDIASARSRLTALAAQASQDSSVMQDSAWRQEMAATLALVEQIASSTSDSSSGAGSGAGSPPDAARLRGLMGGITDDLASILEAFASGIDSSRNPINNRRALDQAAAHLDSATRQANDVLAEVEAMRKAAQTASGHR